jgi:hypothetical protein
MPPFLFLLATGCLGDRVISETADPDCEQAEHFPTLTADDACDGPETAENCPAGL